MGTWFARYICFAVICAEAPSFGYYRGGSLGPLWPIVICSVELYGALPREMPFGDLGSSVSDFGPTRTLLVAW